jgi:hypothetical protein
MSPIVMVALVRRAYLTFEVRSLTALERWFSWESLPLSLHLYFEHGHDQATPAPSSRLGYLGGRTECSSGFPLISDIC